MTERNYLRVKPFEFESIEEKDGKLFYVKSKSEYLTYLGFWLRFCHVHFRPCPDCQKRLMKEIAEADNWIFGNKDAEPQIELYKHTDEINDHAWEEIERREVSEKEAERLAKEEGVTWSG
jgi:hypothetical protein